MSWEDDHREDGLWARVEEAQGVLEEHVRAEALDTSDARVQQLRAILSILIGYRDHPDVLITPVARKNTGKVVETITSQLPGIEGIYKPPAGGTVSKFEELARNLRSWPQRGSVKLVGLTQQVQQLDSTLAGFKESASRNMEELMKEGESAADTLRENHAKTLEDLRGEIGQLSSEIQNLTNRSESVSTTVSESEGRIEEAIKTQKTEFQTERKERADQFEEVMQGQVDAFQEFYNESSGRTDSLVASIESKEKDAEAILGTLAQRSTAENYGEWAKQQRRAAGWWSAIAVVLFVLAAGVFIESTFQFITSPSVIPSGESLWSEVVTRLGMTAVVLAGALYAAKEAGQHRKEERQAKARELVLTTMDPFLVNIHEDVRELIRSEAARSIFVLRDQDGSSEDEKQMSDRLRDIVRSRTREDKGQEPDGTASTHRE